MEVITQNLSPEQETRSIGDFQVIEKLTQAAPNLGMRVIISGGYAVDGFLGKITRPHNDIDIQIYGIESNPERAVERILDAISSDQFKYTMKDKGRSKYYHNLLYHYEDNSDSFNRRTLWLEKEFI